MDILPYIYFFYMFVSLYFLLFFILLYIKNKKQLNYTPELKKHFSVSVLIPAWNEEDTIEDTVREVFKSDYDKIVEVIVLNDGSIDKTKEIVERLLKEEKYSKLKLINKKNSGKADSINFGIKKAKGELIAIVDSDSFPRKDAIRKLVGFFEDEKVGVATCAIFARNKIKFFEVLQAFEYAAIALTRKLLEFVDAIFVTPGPLAIYRKKALMDIGGFDKKNLTEDIELTWHLIVSGWKRKMCLDAQVTTWVPSDFKHWWRQRTRWIIGGLQCVIKYKGYFLKKNIMGMFVWPFFVFNSILGLLGLGIFVYLMVTRLFKQYLIMKFSFVAETAILSVDSIYFTPSILNYFGIVLFVLAAVFTFFILYLVKEDALKKRNFFKIVVYLTLYLMVYPLILVHAIFKFIRRDMRW